ncbi:hypothetical protein CR164_03640 [Prosthecochloris marina]|uniref:CRISPR system Cms protein Csm5 n=1 Tax=Prosthecochloris marina TaxID=2017681 RepID=A0A317T804_9CHLB|nr:RAMP superfamily CRISPR-associated protein [Prosthecochloris marina]PWW82843.1 hypothetical protein CR164_03640 [Prosthecochloris marina]
MSYEEKIERRTVKLTTVTPLHIKGKDIDFGQGFVRRNNYSAYAIDHMKLGNYLLSKNKFEVYLEEVDRLISRRKFKDFNFQKFLKHHHLYDIDKPETHDELIKAGVFKGIVESTNDKQFVRDGMQRPFIPGSSIKGFIRVAYIYEHFKSKLFANRETFETEIRDFDRHLTDIFRFISVTDSCELNIQQLKDETVSIISRNTRNEKILAQAEEGEARVIDMFGKIKLQANGIKMYDIDEKLVKQFFLKTGDIISSYKADKKGKVIKELTVKEKTSVSKPVTQKVISLKFKDKEELECFNGETTFDIILNKNNSNVPFKSIEHVLAALDSFSQKIWELETDFISEITENIASITDIGAFYSQPRTANARLGFGTGLISKTPDSILEETMLTELVNAHFDPKKDPPHTRPKSRRVISFDNNAMLPLGWVRLELIT